uniref:Large ribosomal subunit protein eL22 n=1 Tax=Lygus hesperus TaxID=30085 RepID=A0A0A9WVJ3_LYGHE
MCARKCYTYTQHHTQSAKTAKPANKPMKLTINCKEPVEDAVFDIQNFDEFLRKSLKVKRGEKPGLLRDRVDITTNEDSVVIVAKEAIAKRYIKFLTKKYLCRNTLRDYIRVLSKNRSTLTLRYFMNTRDAGEEDEEAASAATGNDDEQTPTLMHDDQKADANDTVVAGSDPDDIN